MAMNIVSRKMLTDFATTHPTAKTPLDAWFKVASHASWHHLNEVRATFPHADLVGRLTVFNIGGNNFRLITKINYAVGKTHGTIYVRKILTHAEYDKEGWKHDPWF